MSDHVILGIDPGLRVAGYSVISIRDGRTQLVDLGFLEQSSKDALHIRVGTFYELAGKKCDEHGVTVIALETPFLGKNAQTFLKLGYLRGTLYLLAHQKKLTLHEFTPSQVKMAVTGSGSAQKDQLARALAMMVPDLNKVKAAAKNDVTDALGVAFCGALSASSIRF